MTPAHWVAFHGTLTRLLDRDGITRAGLEDLRDYFQPAQANGWRPFVAPDGYRMQAEALVQRLDRLLEEDR